MPYTIKELLKVAKENQLAVPVFNVCSYDMMKTIIEETGRLEVPVILEVHPDEIAYLGDEFVAAVRAYAYTSKPLTVIHLNYGGTIEDVLRAIRNGYFSVMIDASLKLLDDNVRITKKAVALARAVDVSVEAELGTIGSNGSAEGSAETIIYIDPDQAKTFVKEIGIDTLAVAIGMAHGLYPKDRTPKLNIDLLEELNQQTDLPFVPRGGSGSPDAEVSETAKHGVAKVSLSSDLKSVFSNVLREILSENPSMYKPNAIYSATNKKVQEMVEHKMEILSTVGKASLY